MGWSSSIKPLYIGGTTFSISDRHQLSPSLPLFLSFSISVSPPFLYNTSISLPLPLSFSPSFPPYLSLSLRLSSIIRLYPSLSFSFPLESVACLPLFVLMLNCAILIPLDKNRATNRGCGDGPGSSMGLFIKGGWTKIRFRQTVSGRSSCYSHLGHARYQGQ